MRYQAALRPDGKLIGGITYLFNKRKKDEMIHNVNVCRLFWGAFGGKEFKTLPTKSILIKPALIFWGQIWGQGLPRNIRVMRLSKNNLNRKVER
jgi:hypothetical protein